MIVIRISAERKAKEQRYIAAAESAATLEDAAAKLGISKQALSQFLQRRGYRVTRWNTEPEKPL